MADDDRRDDKQRWDRFSFLQSPKPFSTTSSSNKMPQFPPFARDDDEFEKFFQNSSAAKLLNQHDRFGSMDRIRNRQKSPTQTTRPADDSDWPGKFTSRLGGDMPSLDRFQFASDQQLGGNGGGRSFFDNTMDDMKKRFFEDDKVPRMAEWGFMPGDDVPESRRFPTGFHGDTLPRSSGSESSRVKERLVPIRVEGRPTAPPKPAPPFKPPELRATHEIPRFTAPPPSTCQQSATGAAESDRIKERVVPIKIHSSNIEHVAPPSGDKFPQQQQQPKVQPNFEPDAMLQKLHETPLLSDRLAGKITRFDEFSDIISQFPKQPVWMSTIITQPEQQPPTSVDTESTKSSVADDQQTAIGDTKVQNTTAEITRLADSSALVERLDCSTCQEEVPNTVKLFDDALSEPLKNFGEAGRQIGGDVQEITDLTSQAISALRVFVWNAAGSTKPTDDAAFSQQLRPISEKIERVQGLKNSKRTSPFFNHLSAIAEGIPALGWVTITPTPAPYIKEMSDASQFYTNRVLKDFKDKDKVHTDWSKAWLNILSAMQLYVKQNHTTGLVWNSSPGAGKATLVTEQVTPAVNKTVAPKAVSGAGAPPPPPPPPPTSLLLDDVQSSKSEADSRAALFADINKGADVTKGLKKVTDDMKTHKNPALKQTSTVPGKNALQQPVSGSPQKPAGDAVNCHAPKVELEGGKKWSIEYVKDNNNVVVNVTDMKQVAYIYKCSNSVIQIKGKINSITMDGCNKTSLVFDDLVSSVEVINCQRAQIQSLGTMPTLAIQKTDGCQIYLSPASLNAEIVTSKSSEMNVLVPNANGEYDEFPVPEQYKTVWGGKKLNTSVVDIA